MVRALTNCINELEIKHNTCAAMTDEDTFKRLKESVIGDAEHMQPIREAVGSS